MRVCVCEIHPDIVVKMSLVQSYLEKHQLASILEGMINTTVKKRVDEPLAYMADYLASLAPSRVVGVSFASRVARNGCELYDVCVTTAKGRYFSSVSQWASKEDVESVVAAAATSWVGMDPKDQARCDAALCGAIGGGDVDEGKGKRAARYAMSTCLCRAGAGEAKVSVAEHVAKLLAKRSDSSAAEENNKEQGQFPWIPVPSVAVFEQPGNALPFAGVRILATGAATLDEAMELCTHVHKALSDVLAADKACAPWVTKGPGSGGGFLPVGAAPMDMAKFLSMIQQAVKSAGAEGKIVAALDVGGQDLMVPAPPPPSEDAPRMPHSYNVHALGDAKAKPNPKTIEQFSSMLEELSNTFSVVHLGEPFASEDRGERQASALLAEKRECLAQVAYSALSVEGAEAVAVACNSLMIPLDELPSVEDALALARWARNNGRTMAITCTPHEGQDRDAFPVDFAAGIRAGQLYVGPTHGDFIGLWNGLRALSVSLGDEAEFAGEMATIQKKLGDLDAVEAVGMHNCPSENVN